MFSKKQRTKVFRQRRKSTIGQEYTSLKTWNSIVFIESLFIENLCKTSLLKNAKERTRLGRFCFVNGKSLKESTFLEHGQGALHKPADCI